MEIFWRKYNDLNKLENALKNKFNSKSITFYDSSSYSGIIV